MNISEIKKPIRDRKKKVLDLAKIFFGVIIVLTFFSKSFYSWTLPKVRPERIGSGSLTKEIMGEGIVEAKDRIEHYVSVRGQIKDIRVSAGDKVKKGDIIMALDKRDLEKELERKNIELSELKLKYEGIVSDKESNNINSYEQGLNELEEDLSCKEKEYLLYKALYEKGAESRNVYETKEKEYNSAKSKLDNFKKDFELQQQNSLREIEAAKLAIAKIELDIRDIREEIDDCNVTAPSDGVIKEINFKKGMMPNNSVPTYILDNMTGGFEIKVDLNGGLCEYINLEEKVQIKIKNKGNMSVDGTIKAISDKKDDYSKKTITVDLGQADLLGGEAGELYFKRKIGSYDIIIPRSAIVKDSEGECVFVLEEKEGPLGKEYHVLKRKVTVGDSDNSYIGILSGLLGGEKVIVYSNKSLYDGSSVILGE